MNQLIAALGSDIKPSGKNWTARCPVHGDKDFAMSIEQADDLSVLAHCHACGANGVDLYKHLGLDLDELFGGKKLDKRPIPPHIVEKFEHECMVFMIARFKYRRNALNYRDKKRYRLAMARMIGITGKF